MTATDTAPGSRPHASLRAIPVAAITLPSAWRCVRETCGVELEDRSG